MVQKTDWEAMAANNLKAELKRHGVTYAQLVEKLAAIGVDDKEVNVRNKLARGKFTAAFLFQCLRAIGVDHLRL
jgi:3-mercaptopyruvate sulfurtransferase SseA